MNQSLYDDDHRKSAEHASSFQSTSFPTQRSPTPPVFIGLTDETRVKLKEIVRTLPLKESDVFLRSILNVINTDSVRAREIVETEYKKIHAP